MPGVAGIHVEGPFINDARRGVHDASKIRSLDASDVALLSSLGTGRTLVLAPTGGPFARPSKFLVVDTRRMRAVRTITSDAADALGLAGVTGAIRPGLAADLVAVEGDPIPDADGPGGHAGDARLAGLRRVRDVIQGGRPVVRDGHALV